MYRLINENIDLILGRPLLARDVKDYIRLMQMFREADVSVDESFHFAYRQYWKMNAARLDNGFYSHYFSMMQRLRSNGTVSVDSVSEELYRHRPQKGIQFSFASKLVHMIDPHKPIFDSFVATFYFFTPPTKPTRKHDEPEAAYIKRDLEKRVPALRGFYDFLEREFTRILGDGLLRDAIGKFRKAHPHCTEDVYTNQKIIDALIWHFVDACRDREVAFR
jgi:hypothetical protein